MKRTLTMTVAIVGLSADFVAGCSAAPNGAPSGNDAGGQDATVLAEGGALLDAGGDLGDGAIADAATDVSTVDASSSDASSSGDACAPTGTGAVGVLGCPCTTPGQLACNGNAQKVTLLCSGGTWTYNSTCPAGDNCDSATGSNQGICLPIDPLCTSASPGQAVCKDATTVVQCGPDLVTDSPVTICSNQTCVTGTCTGVCGPAQVNCDGQQPQICSTIGIWENSGAACASQACEDGGCAGICTPNTRECTSDTQISTCGTNGQWGTPTICTDDAGVGACMGTIDVVGGNCVACKSGVASPQCQGNTPQFCGDAGAWISESACTGAMPYCSGGSCTPFMEFTIPTTNSWPEGITAGPDGNLWFTEQSGNKIGRITTVGVITEFPLPTANSGPVGITLGPDGNLWFTEAAGNRIGEVSTSGSFTEYPLATSDSGPGPEPFLITSGPDGNLWFTEISGNKIGRITTSGVITEFPLTGGADSPWGITSGPDGNLWFTTQIPLATGHIGRITTAGVITEFAIPTTNAVPNGITLGPDGNLWFAENDASKIGMITTAGVITEFNPSGEPQEPEGITSGPDGNLWFTESFENGNIAKVTTSGVITEFPLPKFSNPSAGGPQPWGITSGPDGNIWFTEQVGNGIGRINPSL